MKRNSIIKYLEKISGKTIAVVYSFRNENDGSFQHYDFWKSDVITDWVKAVEELNCIPYIVDVRTFITGAVTKSLPQIDYAVNLNAGNRKSSILGLVPAICGLLQIPCIPSGIVPIITGEDKRLTNLIANSLKFNVPPDIPSHAADGIFKPNNYGSSIGIVKGQKPEKQNGIYQKFIKGFDLTTPVLFNPLTNRMEVMPGVLYIPDPINVNWFHGEEEKKIGIGYQKVTVNLAGESKEMYLSMVQSFNISTFCRIDARLKCDNPDEIYSIMKSDIPFNRIFFLELNPMPTVNNNINFTNSVNRLDASYEMKQVYDLYQSVQTSAGVVSFILFCSVIAKSDYNQAL